MLAACVIVAATTAFAQFKDNGGKAGTADTSAVGQSTEFANVTTTFDGVEFRLLRLIREPKDKSKLRLVAQLVNVGDSDRWIAFILPYPALVDELGNYYAVTINPVKNNSNGKVAVTGVDACYDYGQWTEDVRNCTYGNESTSGTRLAPSVPVTVMVGFEPSTDGNYDASLALMATFVGLNLHFAMSAKQLNQVGSNSASDIRAAIPIYEVAIPQIPMPAQE